MKILTCIILAISLILNGCSKSKVDKEDTETLLTSGTWEGVKSVINNQVQQDFPSRKFIATFNNGNAEFREKTNNVLVFEGSYNIVNREKGHIVLIDRSGKAYAKLIVDKITRTYLELFIEYQNSTYDTRLIHFVRTDN